MYILEMNKNVFELFCILDKFTTLINSKKFYVRNGKLIILDKTKGEIAEEFNKYWEVIERKKY